MKIIKPTNNSITGVYTATHRAYDFAGLNLPDEIRSVKDGTVIETSNLYNTNWKNTGKLTIADYGNYTKVKHNDGTIALYTHLKQHSMLGIGTKVNQGQVIARIGNTGNSTGPHLHFEFRNSSNVNIPVEFEENLDPLQECLRQHGELVKENTELKKQISDLKASEERLKKEKDVAIQEAERKYSALSASKDRECQSKMNEIKLKIKNYIDSV